jgi:putative MATE family efflux protein
MSTSFNRPIVRFLRDNTQALTEVISSGTPVSRGRQFRLAATLSLPAIMAQISAIVMEYIDASMVGSLGAEASASIGLVSTSTWVFMGLTSSAAQGFSVQVAHQLGGGHTEAARSVFRQSLVATLLFSLVLAAVGLAISPALPGWLGGAEEICAAATSYFAVFVAALPIMQYRFLAGGMLRCSGNMLYPGLVGVAGCALDILFNYLLIFPTRTVALGSLSLTLPGAGLGVLGAALGTVAAELVSVTLLMREALFRSPSLRLWRTHGSFRLRRACMRRAFRIGLPMGVEHFLTSGAQVVLTIIVAPLGTCAIAANAFAITAESLCYMPGYGISDAATTLVGQSLGAGRRTLARQFGYTCVVMGMVVMSLLGVVLYWAAPAIIGVMTPDAEIVRLGTMALRTEAWAEPMFAASIVAYGVFVGAGDTLVPCCFNLGSMWVVRITLAALLAPLYGLQGVWIAMCIELCFRGLLFLLRLRTQAWQAHIEKIIN